MSTFLFIWNPKDDIWKSLPEQAAATTAGSSVKSRWSSGNRKSILPGARMFLMMVGMGERCGVMGAGRALTEPHEGPHRIPARRVRGEKSLWVDCEWDCLINPEVDEPLLLTQLAQGELGAFRNWTPQSSGVQIPPNIAKKLEQAWKEHIASLAADSNADFDEELAAVEGEERTALVLHRRRERRLRMAKIESVKRQAGRLVCEVPGCRFDFYEAYGELGRNFCHVHHLQPLSDRALPSETLLSDLAIVCANCHAMIHLGGKCRPLEGLIQG